MSRAFCGIGPIPRGARAGTMKECADTGTVGQYGMKKIDPKLVDYAIAKYLIKKKLDSKKLHKKIIEIRADIVRCKKEIERTNKKAEKSAFAKELKEHEARKKVYEKIHRYVVAEEKKKKDARKTTTKSKTKTKSKK